MSKQGGLTMISWLVVISVALFFLMIGIKMVPTYLNNYSLKEVLAAIQNDHTMRNMTPAQIRYDIMKRLSINGVYNFPQNEIKFSRGDNNSLLINVKYEVRKPVAGNVSVVMAFHDQATIYQ